jgi:hypothetical protein
MEVETMDLVVYTYSAYLLVSVGMTIWVATTLSRNGQVFLEKVFDDNRALASSVNHLLVVGFYLINFGFVSLMLKLGYNVFSLRESIEALSSKIGIVLLVLGGMHFFNLYIFSRIDLKTDDAPANPPVLPDGYTPIGAK